MQIQYKTGYLWVWVPAQLQLLLRPLSASFPRLLERESAKGCRCTEDSPKSESVISGNDYPPEILDRSLAHIQITVTCLDNKKAFTYEKASPPAQRILAAACKPKPRGLL